MTPTKLLIGQILIVLAIMILGVWAATQWAAAMLAYQPQLGAPWFFLGDLPVYRPWALFPWWSTTASVGATMSSTGCSGPPSFASAGSASRLFASSEARARASASVAGGPHERGGTRRGAGCRAEGGP